MKKSMLLLIVFLTFGLLIFGQDVSGNSGSDILNKIAQWWFVWIPIILVIAEAIVRITPTEKDNSILNNIMKIINVLNTVLPNKSKTGGSFTLSSKEKPKK